MGIYVFRGTPRISARSLLFLVYINDLVDNVDSDVKCFSATHHSFLMFVMRQQLRNNLIGIRRGYVYGHGHGKQNSMPAKLKK